MTFICAECHNHILMKHLAFTFEYNNDGVIETEGVCGDCAEP